MKGSCWANVKKRPELVENPNSKVYRDATLTRVKLRLRLFAWQWNLNKSCSPYYVEQTLFLDQGLIRLLRVSIRDFKNQLSAVLKLQKSAVLELKYSVFKFREPHFGTLYLSNQAALDFDTLNKVGDLA